jgi:UDP-N-acetylmuramyl pentapeptide phosphotransferase/UDP-N-acetylglucosamine-1-phosphate transferase
MPGVARILAMWVHEAGHAVAAWLSGFAAFPGPWITVVGNERSLLVTVMLIGLLSYGACVAWQRRRWFWVAAAAVVSAAALFCTFGLRPFEARQFVTFAGDGGSFVLGTFLMLTIYARADHPLRQERLRWAFLVIGALAFVIAAGNWLGGVDSIPFGEDGRGLSDPSVLMEEHGWSAPLLIQRYTQLSNGCLAVLAVAYIAGMADAYASSSSSSSRRVASALP